MRVASNVKGGEKIKWGWRGGGREKKQNRLEGKLRARLLTTCILMWNCGNPARQRQAAAKVTRDYQDHD